MDDGRTPWSSSSDAWAGCPSGHDGGRSGGGRTRCGHATTATTATTATATSGTSAASAAASPPAPRVRLSGSVGALPTGSAVLGPADSQQPAGADVVLQPRDPAALQSFAAAVSTPGSPSYRDYLSTAAFRQEFGPRPQTVTAVRVWLAGSGLALGATSANGMIVPVSGTVGRLEQVFAVPLVRARLPGGRVARAVTADPEVPASLAPAIEGVVGLSTVVEAHPQLATDPLAPHPTRHGGGRALRGVAGTIGRSRRRRGRMSDPPPARRPPPPPPPTAVGRPTAWPRPTGSPPFTVPAGWERDSRSASSSWRRMCRVTSPPTRPASARAPRSPT